MVESLFCLPVSFENNYIKNIIFQNKKMLGFIGVILGVVSLGLILSDSQQQIITTTTSSITSTPSPFTPNITVVFDSDVNNLLNGGYRYGNSFNKIVCTWGHALVHLDAKF